MLDEEEVSRRKHITYIHTKTNYKTLLRNTVVIIMREIYILFKSFENLSDVHFTKTEIN